MIVVGRLIKVKNANSTWKSSGDQTLFDDGHRFGSAVVLHPFFSYIIPYRIPRNSTLVPEQFNSNGQEREASGPDAPPERLTVDYVEMAILIAMVLTGGPLNFVSLFRSLRSDTPRFFALFKTFRENRSPGEASSGKSRGSLYLKVHLTIANLLVIWVYALSDLCWLATYSWRGGDFMCRIVRFVHAFCFYATSNLVTTIAIQRLTVAMRMDRPPSTRQRPNAPPHGPPEGRGMACRRTRLAYGAWILAFLCSVPQLVIWRAFELYPGWEQCVTTWTIARYNQQTRDTDGPEEGEEQEKIYNGFHLAFVFWLPVLIIFVCYFLIVSRFHRKIRKQAMQIEAEATAAVESRAANVRASLVLGGPVDAGSPLLLPIAVYRALQYQTMHDEEAGNSKAVAIPKQAPVLRARRRRRPLVCLPFRQRSASRVDSVTDDEEMDQSGYLAAASILSATLIGANRPRARKSFAIATLARAKKRTMRKTIWILLSYLLCWSPYNVLVLWRYFDRHVDLYDFEIMYNLIVLNAVINPLIYGI